MKILHLSDTYLDRAGGPDADGADGTAAPTRRPGRIRRDLHPLRAGDETVTDLKILTGRRTDLFDVITGMPGLGIILGAEFLAAAGGDMAVFGTPDRLASFAGVAPVPRDSGRISGNLRRPQRYNRRLQRVLYTSALFSIRRSEESRRFYDRERAEDQRHTQAVLALARRRVNVLWALLRDGQCYELTPPTALAA